MKLETLLKDIACRQVTGNVETDIKDLKCDCRQVQPGDLFVAVRGTVTDGHRFVDEAIERGAVAVVCERLPEELRPHVTYVCVHDTAEALGLLASARHGHPSSRLVLIGVTGTNGKTTIATLLYRLFKALGYKAGLISTVVNYVDDEAVEATHTTPDALTLNALLARMVEAGCRYAFMEVSSHAVDQRRIAGLRFDGGIFTNLTRDHIDYHKTFEHYLKSKKRFFDDLPQGAFALFNRDDKNGAVMLQNTKARKCAYSLRGMADFQTKILECDLRGMLLSMNGQELSVQFVGKFNAGNLTAVFGAAVLLGQDKAEVLRLISSLRPVSGRFETLYAPSGYVAVVDYAHTPDALNNVMGTIKQVLSGKPGRLITVVGCGGNRDKGKRPMMAREAVNGSWKTVLTSDNPRREDPQAIIDDMMEGVDEADRRKVLSILNRREAIRTACALAAPGDVVLVAGKGHETYQIIGEEKHHFDDKEEIINCF